MQKKTFIFILTLFAATCFAAETDKIASSEKDAEKVTEKELSQVEYWVIRSHALTELTPFLAKTRREAKGHYDMLTDYLKYIEKGQEFAQSGIKVPYSPAEYAKAIGKTEQFVEKNIDLPNKPMTWEQLVEWAMEFVQQEGYIPTDIKDAEELDRFKKICQQKEKYGRKVRDELRKLAEDCLEIKAYLESIDQFEACKRYTLYQKEEEAKAKKERLKEGREEAVAKKRRRQEWERKNEWLDRQRRLTNNYQRRMHASRIRSRGGYGYYRW